MLDFCISNGFCFLGMAQHEYETKNLEYRDLKVFDPLYNLKVFILNELQMNMNII